MALEVVGVIVEDTTEDISVSVVGTSENVLVVVEENE